MKAGGQIADGTGAANWAIPSTDKQAGDPIRKAGAGEGSWASGERKIASCRELSTPS